MKENSKASFLALCLFILLTIPLDRAVNAAADIVASRGLDTNWFFGMDHAFQSAIVAIIPTIFGYLLFKHIEELKEEPQEPVVTAEPLKAPEVVNKAEEIIDETFYLEKDIRNTLKAMRKEGKIKTVKVTSQTERGLGGDDVIIFN